jgi:DNA-binding LytR/AlgR family response regulator
MKLRCIIIDDEPFARNGLQEYIADITYLQQVGSFESALTAGEYLIKNPVDLMLLDIHMPRLSGIDFLKSLVTPPLVIFTTAYADYALESYELNVIDYLVKPISFERFKSASQKAFDYFSLKQRNTASEYFFIKCNHNLVKVFFNEVLYVEAMQNYCIIHTPARKLISYITLTAMIEKLPAEHFMKIHKSYIVALSKITRLDGDSVVMGTASIPISRSLKKEVAARILGDNLLKR